MPDRFVQKSGSTGAAMIEARHINKTLSALGNVMEALAKKAAHVPYRYLRAKVVSSKVIAVAW